jgi:dTDP-4-amino-4,6-dideoxygalactose transaminase
VILPFVDPQGLHARHIYPVQVPAARRDDLIQGLHAAGIGTTVHYIPIHHHSYFQAHLSYRPGDFPHTDAYFARAITLPLYVGMGEDAVARVCESLRALLEK